MDQLVAEHEGPRGGNLGLEPERPKEGSSEELSKKTAARNR